ncbi:hypothetical protein DPV78_009094 [Talaromyces pinophilus]|nr:hypothetical protein DPV78_009094 [Talaromyces pinophilus]
MNRPKPHPPSAPDLKTHSSLSIATNLLLRCEHFFRSLAFLEHASAEDPARTLRQIYSLCRDFHETLFIIDQTLYRHRLQFSNTKKRGHHHHHHHHHEDEQGEEDDEGYRVLSEITEQLTDYAFLAGNRIHPWDVPYSFAEPESGSSSTTASFGSVSSASTAKAAAAAEGGKVLVPNPVEFPPSKWKNRELRKTRLPLAGFRLVDRSVGKD